MCGIAGALDLRAQREFPRSALRAMGEALAHRGPDGDGLHREPGFAVICKRLSLVDIEGGAQPMHDPSGRLWVAFNGELFNDDSLRESLHRHGRHLQTKCDTELWLHLWELHQERLLQFTKGQYAVSSALLPLMQAPPDRALRALYAPGTIFPVNAPLLVQIIAALLLLELIQYTTHRAMHWSPYLWRFHAMHHSPERMQMWCAFRNHPVDTFLTVALPVAPLSWLGAPVEVVALSVALVGANATLQHANIGLRDTVFSWLLSTAGLHRVHHQRDAASNSNYGGFLILWDLVFKTRKASTQELPLLGIDAKDWFPKRYWGQLLSPFSSKWRP